MKVALADILALNDDELDYLKSLGYEITTFNTFDQYTEPTDVIVGYNPPSEAIPDGLKFVQLLSAGFDHVNLDLYQDNDITIANGKGMYSKPIAEYTLAHILSIYKSIPDYRSQQDFKKWNRLDKNKSLDQATVLILGTGSIGQETAKLLSAFNATVDGINTNGRAIDYFNQCFPTTSLDEIMHTYDIVISILPQNKATYHIMDQEQFKRMKNDAVFINVGRGSSVNLDGLMAVLDTNLCAVVLDVFEQEPLDPKHPLWHHPKAILTPHASFESNLINTYRLNIVIENLKRFAHNEAIINKII
ncbi:NAD(P)-dependent oxidoreductase [Erysipelothrix urinaevulpis]|uniref:NAD(P)-dependent oxidoreductase n=1 Tax=Erysipelothrix urinaevulpis TaxID=2683717 RepID=UPI00135791C7|nr:NAD(P)-dependent oxidoreductase [Erysipelothrix urinaevulpis]